MRFRHAGGFSALELIMAMAVMGIMLAVGYSGYKQFNETLTVRKAAGQVASDVALTRSFAIQRRQNVSLVANEAQRSYVIRAGDGSVLARRSFDAQSGVGLDYLTVHTAGDSVTFNSRGVMMGGGGVNIDVGRRGRLRHVYVNALGRYTINDE